MRILFAFVFALLLYLAGSAIMNLESEGTGSHTLVKTLHATVAMLNWLSLVSLTTTLYLIYESVKQLRILRALPHRSQYILYHEILEDEHFRPEPFAWIAAPITFILLVLLFLGIRLYLPLADSLSACL
jgi:hypothetical protein